MTTPLQTMSVPQVAAAIGKSPESVRAYVRNGSLKRPDIRVSPTRSVWDRAYIREWWLVRGGVDIDATTAATAPAGLLQELDQAIATTAGGLAQLTRIRALIASEEGGK